MDRELNQRLKSYGATYWDFGDFKKEGIHRIAQYPAMMVPPMQHTLMEDIIRTEGNVFNLFDPFHGSGTTLVEGNQFGLDLIGIDINPLANLITKVKLYGVDKNTIYNSNEQLIYNINRLLELGVKRHSFDKISKWFREDIIHDLSVIRESIILEKNPMNRAYYWVCLSDLVRKYSNTRSSTFKLHVKEAGKIIEMQNNVIKDFIGSVQSNHEYLENEKSNKKYLILGDAIRSMFTLADNSVDLICTSPPYGDNGTTVTYGQFSILALLWIHPFDLQEQAIPLMENFSCIDSHSLGGRIHRSVSSASQSETLLGILENLSGKKQRRVNSFFYDYFLALSEMIRILRKEHLMVLTLGNRRVDNIEIKLDEITREFCVNRGLSVEATVVRNITKKRMPRRVSHVADIGSVQSMNHETVLVMRKCT